MSKRILVIEDDPAVRLTICENLRESGYDIIEAADGEEGLSMIAATENLALVITDIIMPHKEGIETIIAIKKQYPGIKLLAISGGGRTKSMDFLEVAQKLGADIIMPKPLDIDELERSVESLLS
jgi:DNA-binding response OmpR family regulator